MQQQFTVETIRCFPDNIQRLIKHTVWLQDKLFQCPLYQLSSLSSLRDELDKTIDQMNNVLFHLVKYQLDKEESRNANCAAMEKQARLMAYLAEKLGEIMIDQPGIAHTYTDSDKKFFSDPDLFKNMLGLVGLFNEISKLADKINPPYRYDNWPVNPYYGLGRMLNAMFTEPEVEVKNDEEARPAMAGP